MGNDFFAYLPTVVLYEYVLIGLSGRGIDADFGA
jgi:hypothetical protein